MNTPNSMRFDVEVERDDAFRFVIDFGLDGVTTLRTDEPPPLGGGDGPNPARLLAAAVGNCLAASLTFCMQKAGRDLKGVLAHVSGTFTRTPRGRLRIGQLDVVLTVDAAAESQEALEGCLGRFEDFCVVTESVREGIDVMVEVRTRDEQPAPGGHDEAESEEERELMEVPAA